MTFERVLFLGAHPDDEMGCAGLLHHLARREAHIEVLTFSRCSDLNDEVLLDEWRTALMVLGVSASEMLDLPNRRLPEHRAAILEALDDRRGQPDLVLCPATYDAHQDHAAVAAEARRVFKGTTILGYELPLNHVSSVRLDAFVSLSSDDMDAKHMHAAAYRSQSPKPYMSPDYIEGLARVRGVQAGARWAEAFEVVRWII